VSQHGDTFEILKNKSSQNGKLLPRKQGVSDTIFPFYFLLCCHDAKIQPKKKSSMNDNH
jgi:hypothetical protein